MGLKLEQKPYDQYLILTGKHNITVQQLIFIYNYATTHNQTDAYSIAFQNNNRKSSAVQANRLLKKPNIIQAYNEIVSNTIDNLSDNLTNMLANAIVIANSNVDNLIVIKDGSISLQDHLSSKQLQQVQEVNITNTATITGGVKKITSTNLRLKVHDPLKAIKLLVDFVQSGKTTAGNKYNIQW